MLDDDESIAWPRPDRDVDDPCLDVAEELMADQNGKKFPVNAWKRKRQELWDQLDGDIQAEWEEIAVMNRPTLDDADFRRVAPHAQHDLG